MPTAKEVRRAFGERVRRMGFDGPDTGSWERRISADLSVRLDLGWAPSTGGADLYVSLISASANALRQAAQADGDDRVDDRLVIINALNLVSPDDVRIFTVGDDATAFADRIAALVGDVVMPFVEAHRTPAGILELVDQYAGLPERHEAAAVLLWTQGERQGAIERLERVIPRRRPRNATDRRLLNLGAIMDRSA